MSTNQWIIVICICVSWYEGLRVTGKHRVKLVNGAIVYATQDELDHWCMWNKDAEAYDVLTPQVDSDKVHGYLLKAYQSTWSQSDRDATPLPLTMLP